MLGILFLLNAANTVPFMCTLKVWKQQPNTDLKIALCISVWNYLVMSLAHLHLLFLKHINISILRVCNQDTPYILAYATVVSLALEYKPFIEKKKQKKKQKKTKTKKR